MAGKTSRLVEWSAENLLTRLPCCGPVLAAASNKDFIAELESVRWGSKEKGVWLCLRFFTVFDRLYIYIEMQKMTFETTPLTWQKGGRGHFLVVILFLLIKGTQGSTSQIFRTSKFALHCRWARSLASWGLSERISWETPRRGGPCILTEYYSVLLSPSSISSPVDRLFINISISAKSNPGRPAVRPGRADLLLVPLADQQLHHQLHHRQQHRHLWRQLISRLFLLLWVLSISIQMVGLCSCSSIQPSPGQQVFFFTGGIYGPVLILFLSNNSVLSKNYFERSSKQLVGFKTVWKVVCQLLFQFARKTSFIFQKSQTKMTA